MSSLGRFEKLQKNKKFKVAVFFFHALAGGHLFSIFNKMSSQTIDGMFVIFYAIVLASYWKFIARMKRKEFDKG